jgi:hypothetical protein
MTLVEDGLTLARVVDDADRRGSRVLPLASNAWPAWELPDDLARQIIERFLTEVSGIVGVGSGPAGRAALDRLDDFEARHAVAIVLARLERGVVERGLRASALDGVAAWYEFGSGTPEPGRAWLVSRRDDLADLARYTIELAHARRRGETNRESVLRGIVAERAAFLLEVIASE